MGIFGGDGHKYVVKKDFNQLSLSNGRWQMCEMGHLKKIHFKHVLADNSNPNLMQSKNKNMVYYTTYTINIAIILRI